MRPSFFDASHRRGGFTLIELVIVVAIIGIVAVVAVPKVLSTLDSARVNSATTSVIQLQLGLERYYVDNQGYPTGISSYEQLASLVSTYTPVPATPADYSFISYTPYDNKQSMNPCTAGQRCWYYTMAVAARDHSSTPIQVTPEKVSIVDSTTVTETPAGPTALVATATSYDTINLSWLGSLLGSSYNVHRSGTPGFTADASNLVASVGSDVLQYNDTGRAPVTTYYYQVVAVNPVGTSPASAEASATTQPLPPAPQAPTLTQVAAQSDTTIALTWSTAATATSYKVMRGPDNNVAVNGTVVYTGPQTAYTDTGLQPSTTYWYAVIATNVGGPSVGSNALSATTWPSKPPAPATVTATGLDYDMMSVSWPASPTAESYKVYRSTDPTFLTSTEVAAGLATTSFTDNNLNANTVYHYKVIAVNISGESPLSNPGSGQTLGLPAVPDAPTVTLTLQAKDAIQVNWNNPARAKSYNVYRSTQQGFTPDAVTRILYGSTGASTVSGGLYTETTYYYVVSAVNISGETFSTEVSLLTGPGVPQNLVATPTSSSKITLSWTPSLDSSTTYMLYRGTSSGNYALVNTITSPTYVDTNLVSTTTYYYVVTAIRNAFTSLFSSEASAKTTLPPPTTVTALGQSNGSVQVSWSTVNGALGYKVYRGDTPGFQPTGNPLTTTAPGVTSYNDNDVSLTRATTYYYRVTTVDGSAQSDPSAQGIGDTAPLPPSNVQASVQSTSINLSWTASTGATGYSVYRSTTTPVSLIPANRLATNQAGTAYNDASVSPNTVYYYVVTALRNGSESVASSELGVTSAPLGPTGLTYGSPTTSSVVLSWTAVSGATYNVYRHANANPQVIPANQIASNLSSATYTNSGLTSNTDYHYVVTAVKNGVESLPSSDRPATTLALAPTNLATTNPSNKNIDITWTAPTGNASVTYKVFRSPNSNFSGAVLVASNVSGTVYHDSPGNGTFYYKIVATNSAGDSAFSAAVSGQG